MLERRYEFFAIGKPDAGCEFAPDTFDVLSSERFKAAKSLPNTTNPVPVVPKVGTSRVWRWDWIFGVFLGLSCLSLSLLRRGFPADNDWHFSVPIKTIESTKPGACPEWVPEFFSARRRRDNAWHAAA